MIDTRSFGYSFFERPYPSANAILLHGPEPVLVDPGFGNDIEALKVWLLQLGVFPEQVALVVNTHFHSDHVGGNHELQQRYGVEIAAHQREATMVNFRDRNACAAEWLRQPVQSYVVNRSLADGDVIDTGAAKWTVLHTPGHTVGHISLHEPQSGVLVAGDVVHAKDVGWLNIVLEGTNSLQASIESITRLQMLDAKIALSGHGPVITDPTLSLSSARARLERWRTDPEAMAWHAVKRIFAYALIIEGGIDAERLQEYLETCPWFYDFADAPFGKTPLAFTDALLSEMIRSGAAVWRKDKLVSRADHTPTNPAWARVGITPATW